MKVVTPGQMREFDLYAIKTVGIPGVVLMENAAIKVADEIVKDYGCVKDMKICVFAGKGNNGGDAFAVARHLYNNGAKVLVFVLADKKDISGDARINLEILENMGVSTEEVLDEDRLSEIDESLEKTELVVDGIFGTGLKGRVEGYIAEVIKVINEKRVPVIAIDIPSGVNGETGEVCGVCIRAYKTVTFGYPKLGHFLHPGCEFAGKLSVADISIPADVLEKFDIKSEVIDRDMVSERLPKRSQNSNKGDYGRVLAITGSPGMTGAGCLAGAAALRTGTGLLYLGVPNSLSGIYDRNLIEGVTIPLEDGNLGYLTKECVPKLMQTMEKMDAVVVGPGLSTEEGAKDVVFSVVENCPVPLVIDADGLNAVASDISILRRSRTQIIVTPHPGEMARLLGTTVSKVQSNRIETACDFSEKWGVITVLKGSRTIVAVPDGRVFINATGNSGMATAGSGDVLAGIIAGLIGQGLTPADAAIAAVYIHGLCGDRVAEVKGEHGMIAGDLVGELPYVIKELLS